MARKAGLNSTAGTLLGLLAESGQVEALPGEGRGRRPYQTSDDGRATYLEWLQELPGPESVRVPFLLKVAFMDDMPRERFDELLADQRCRHTERLAEYEQSRHRRRAESSSGLRRRWLRRLVSSR